MKKMDQLMAELGFKKDAPQGVKEAFIKHLIKAATGTNVMTPSEKLEMQKSPEKIVPMPMAQQLSFGFIEPTPQPKSRKKAVS